MKKILSILLATTLILTSFATVVFASGNAVFGFGTANITDTTVSVPVYASDVPEGLSNLSAISIWYKYDKEYLKYESTQDGALTGLSGFSNDGVVLWYDATADGSESLSADSLGEDKPLFTLEFSVVSVPEEGIWVKITNSKLSDTEGNIARAPQAYNVIECYLPFSGGSGGDDTTEDDTTGGTTGGDSTGGTTGGDSTGGTTGGDSTGGTTGGDSTGGTTGGTTGGDSTGGTTGGDSSGGSTGGSTSNNTQSGNISSNTGRDDRPSSSGGGLVIAPAPSKPTKASQAFSDVEDSHWAADYALVLYNKGIVSGDASGKANLGNKITREETAKLALLVNGFDVNSTTLNAKDASSVSPWAVSFMATAVERGIFSGYEDGTVKPKANITRQEMVTVIIKALGVEVDEKAYLEFNDNKVITWAAPYIAKAVELGFVSGYEDGTFKPQKDITRAEAFKIFAKVLEYKGL